MIPVPDQPISNIKPRNSITSLIVFGSLAFLILFNLVLLWNTRGHILGGYNDFRAFYSSAVLVYQGRGNQLYDDQAQGEVQSALFADDSGQPEQIPFNHPAYETLILLPLTLLDYHTAIIVWIVVNILILLGLSLYLPRHLPDLPRLPLIIPMLAFGPLIFTILLGQDSIILLMIYALAFASLKQGKPYQAGAILACGLFRFHLVLPFIAIFLIFRHWKFLAGFCAASVVPILTSILITGTEGSRMYINYLFGLNKRAEHLPSNMPNLRGLFSLLLGTGPTAERLIPALAIISSIGLFILVYRSCMRSKPVLDIQFALACVIAILASYFLYAYDLTLLILPIALMINHKPGRETGLRKGAFMIASFLLAASPIYVLLGSQTAVALMAVPIFLLLYLLLTHLRK